MRRRTARALSVAFAAGAVLAVAGPAAAADTDPGAPPAAQIPAPEGAPGPCAAPQQCAYPGSPAAIPDDAAASGYDPALGGRGEGAPGLQGVTPTREGWAPGAAPSAGYGVAQPPVPPQPSQVAPSAPGLAAGRDPYLPSPQGYLPSPQGVTPSHDGAAPTRDGLAPGRDGVGPGHDGVGPGRGDSRDCTGPRPCPDAEPPTVQHGVEAGTGGSFTDSVPALAAGATLIAAACGGAGYRLYGRLRAPVRRSADV